MNHIGPFWSYKELFIGCWDNKVKEELFSLLENSRAITAWKKSKYKLFFARYFPVFGLNTEIYSLNLCIQSKYRKTWTRKNSILHIWTLFTQSISKCIKQNNFLRHGNFVSISAITHKMFETNSSFHVKWRTTGNV